MPDSGIDSSTRFTVLHEHYNETFNFLLRSLSFRDKVFVWLLIYTGAFVFLASFPRQATDVLANILSERTGTDVTLRFQFVNVVVWFGLLALVVRYFQSNVHVSRQYRYLHELEEQLSKEYPRTRVFTREGKFYLTDYPAFSNWVHILYTWIFPLVLTAIFTVKFLGDVALAEPPSANWFLLWGLYLTLLGTIILSLYSTHFEA